MLNDLLVDFSIHHTDGEVTSDQDISEMLVVVENFHRNWPSSYQKLNSLFLGIRRGTVKLDSKDEMERKIKEFKKSLR